MNNKWSNRDKYMIQATITFYQNLDFPYSFGMKSTLDQNRGRKTDGGTRRSQRSGVEEATLVTVDQPFRHCTNQNQHPESGCWISLVHI